MPPNIPMKLGDIGLKMGRHRTNTTIVSDTLKPVANMSKPISQTIIKKAEVMSNKYLEKIAGMAQLASGFGRKAAIGAAVGAGAGALAGGPDHRVAGAVGGAALGGVVGKVLGGKLTPVTSGPSIKAITDQTRTLYPNVTGAGRTKGNSVLANKMKGFSDV